VSRRREHRIGQKLLDRFQRRVTVLAG
jgi:hypothetical protein